MEAPYGSFVASCLKKAVGVRTSIGLDPVRYLTSRVIPAEKY